MTKQEIFNKVWKWFITDKHPQSRDIRGCKYRTKDSACAVGCLIPDELYEPTMEGRGVNGLLMHYPKLQKVLGYDVDLAFLKILQSTHDHYADVLTQPEDFLTKFGRSMAGIAQEHKLKIP